MCSTCWKKRQNLRQRQNLSPRPKAKQKAPVAKLRLEPKLNKPIEDIKVESHSVNSSTWFKPYVDLEKINENLRKQGRKALLASRKKHWNGVKLTVVTK